MLQDESMTADQGTEVLSQPCVPQKRVDRCKQVLLVEDDEVEAKLTSGYLAEQGYEVLHAHDGLDALMQLKRGPLPDIVLLDMQTPRLDGPKTITSIRFDDRLKDLPIIALSDRAPVERDDLKARSSIDFWITKPANPRRLSDAILELLQRRSQATLS